VQYPPPHAFAMLLLVAVESRRICRLGRLQCHNILTKSRGIGHRVQISNGVHTHTHTHTDTQRSKWGLINVLPPPPCRNVIRLNVMDKTLQLKPPKLY
jgi:hypothetical protein